MTNELSAAASTRGRALLRLALLAALVVGTVSLSGSTAAAQDDPYGPTSTTTTSEPEVSAMCNVQLTAGKANAETTVTVSNVPTGGTVRILVGGAEAGRATAPSESSTVQVPITVPDLEPGKYSVSAVGVDFTLRCKVGSGDLFEVLAAGSDNDTEVLAFTGTNILLLIALALALLLVGRKFVKRSHRRTDRHS